MAKNLNLLDRNIMNAIVSELDNTEERTRKKHSYDNWQICSGNQSPYVEEILRHHRPKSYSAYTVSDVSISSMVTNRKAKSYKQSPIRLVDKNNDIKNDRLNDIYDEGNALRQMPYIDKVTCLHRYSLMWVNYIVDEQTKSGAYNFMSLQPHEFSVIRNKTTGELIGVILSGANRDMTQGSNTGDGVGGLLAENQADSSAQSKIYRMWSKDNFVVIKVETNEVFDEQGKTVEQKDITYLANPDNPNNINVLGRIPFVFMSQELSADYPTLNPIGEQSSTFGSLMSELLTSANIQGTSILKFKFPESMQGQFDKINTGMMDAIELPQSNVEGDGETECDFISPSPDLTGQRDSYMSYLEGVLSQHGISVGQAMGKDVEASSSGIAMAIKNANVQDIIEMNQQNLYVPLEKDMFKIIMAWEDYIGQSVFDSNKDELQITFKKPKILISETEVLNNIKIRLELGLMREYQALMELDPNMSEDDAKQEIADTKKDKNDSAIKVMDGFKKEKVSQGNEKTQAGFDRNTPQ